MIKKYWGEDASFLQDIPIVSSEGKVCTAGGGPRMNASHLYGAGMPASMEGY